jgi:hypothetical protein
MDGLSALIESEVSTWPITYTHNVITHERVIRHGLEELNRSEWV